jgi:hypothetical protein
MIKYFLIGANTILLIGILFIIFLDFEIASKNIIMLIFDVSLVFSNLYYIINSEYKLENKIKNHIFVFPIIFTSIIVVIFT